MKSKRRLAMKKDNDGPEKKNDDDSYEVGYRKPSKGSQFKKGQSGNPKGRPKETPTLAAEVDKELKRKITVTENGQSHEVTKRKAVGKRIVNESLGGNLRVCRLAMDLEKKAEIERHEARERKASQRAQVSRRSTDDYVYSVRYALGFRGPEELKAAGLSAEKTKRPRLLAAGEASAEATPESETDASEDEEK
jgi:hypothetical protein